MILQSIKGRLLLTAAAALSSALAYGQATVLPVVPPDAVGPDEARPFNWVMVPAGSSATVNLVRAPGQTACNTSNPCYYVTSDLWTAYGLPALLSRGHYGQGITIGIVDAYYDPQIAQNLVNFSTFSHLPLGTASTSITCATTPTFTVVSQTGGSPSAVRFNTGWAEEANLDVQQAHAMAPCANILLIAANSNANTNLYAGVKYAYAHSDIVSNSYGGNEGTGEVAQDVNFQNTPVPLLFSSGDTGAVSEYPCASPYSTCVGGTSLLTTSTAFRTVESAWYTPATADTTAGGTGGGCSNGGEVQPLYQIGITNSTCGTVRGVPDVAALADPYTGVVIALGSNIASSASVYCCEGGTSLATPLFAGILANVDNARLAAGKAKLGPNLNTLIYNAAKYTPSGDSSLPAPYGNAYRNYFYDVTTGNSGYAATSYWDRTAGLGVPLFSALGNYLITVAP